MAMAEVVPEAYQAVFQLEKYVRSTVAHQLLELVKLRASMINGCAFCVDMHSHDALSAGESTQRLFAVAAWREAPFFTDRERAALALTDEVTRLGDHGVTDATWAKVREHYSEEATANLIMAIATINVWNRIAIATRVAPPVR
ncbi:carboxymuconolactone decarboxylase family protein [Natronosporangium hydrolyticum]|uniref:Carboxymuconolactone decarboxylase family protein n=2 Tax=Natronosporangium hydrolyticum TaxID=2811111 RepID=A0A895YSZ9_9ACTN|nr:carboxymuconolactone decarboxylase family protein [Natronosporangium hydrolyticum]QSB17158.1 carboxymuconolactone decarboxylase family protein [Natronosporangium hydrolyticum]